MTASSPKSLVAYHRDAQAFFAETKSETTTSIRSCFCRNDAAAKLVVAFSAYCCCYNFGSAAIVGIAGKDPRCSVAAADDVENREVD